MVMAVLKLNFPAALMNFDCLRPMTLRPQLSLKYAFFGVLYLLLHKDFG